MNLQYNTKINPGILFSSDFKLRVISWEVDTDRYPDNRALQSHELPFELKK